MSMPAPSRALGAGPILLALGFNVSYAILATAFDHLGILRESPERTLAAFAEGGAGLVLTWYAFALAALVFVLVSLGLALGAGRVRAQPGLAVAVAVLGALAGLTQAMGLLHWVLVVPGLAARPDAAGDFTTLHAFAGVAVGEHLGMLLTAGFVAAMARMQAADGRRAVAAVGGLTALAIEWRRLRGRRGGAGARRRGLRLGRHRGLPAADGVTGAGGGRAAGSPDLGPGDRAAGPGIS